MMALIIYNCTVYIHTYIHIHTHIQNNTKTKLDTPKAVIYKKNKATYRNEKVEYVIKSFAWHNNVELGSIQMYNNIKLTLKILLCFATNVIFKPRS